MDKLTLSTPNTLLLSKQQRLKFTKYLSTTGVGEDGSLRVITTMDEETGVVLKCRPNGLSITFNPSKFYHGNNLEQINLSQLVEVVELLSKYYNTNLTEWNVAAFDWCENITLNHAPEHYLNMMGKLKKYEWEKYKETGKTYNTRSQTKTVSLYNKLEEMKEEQTANVLRIEVGINKAPHTIKQLSEMKTLNDYLEPENYAKLAQVWASMFNQIETNEQLTTLPNLTEREQTLILYLEKFGWEGYRKKLRADHKRSPKTLQRRLKELDTLQAKMIDNTPHSLVKELKEKVELAAQQRVSETLQDRAAIQPETE